MLMVEGTFVGVEVRRENVVGGVITDVCRVEVRADTRVNTYRSNIILNFGSSPCCVKSWPPLAPVNPRSLRVE